MSGSEFHLHLHVNSDGEDRQNTEQNTEAIPEMPVRPRIRLDLDREAPIADPFSIPAPTPAEPEVRVSQYTTDERGGGQVRLAEIDADGDGDRDGFEFVQRRDDGSSLRVNEVEGGEGTRSQRAAEVDARGRVRSMREQQFDEDGRLLAGRYDDNGDGRIDREFRDIDGDGQGEWILNHPRSRKRLDWQAEGAWQYDLDGDGRTDFASGFDARGGQVDQQFRVERDGETQAVDRVSLDRRGALRELKADTDGDGRLDDGRLVVRSDADGEVTGLHSECRSAGIVETHTDQDGDGRTDSSTYGVDALAALFADPVETGEDPFLVFERKAF